jgi:hypothetical protein
VRARVSPVAQVDGIISVAVLCAPCMMIHSPCLIKPSCTRSKHNRYKVSLLQFSCFGTPGVPSSGKPCGNIITAFEWVQCVNTELVQCIKHGFGPELVQCIRHSLFIHCANSKALLELTQILPGEGTPAVPKHEPYEGKYVSIVFTFGA